MSCEPYLIRKTLDNKTVNLSKGILDKVTGSPICSATLILGCYSKRGAIQRNPLDDILPDSLISWLHERDRHYRQDDGEEVD